MAPQDSMSDALRQLKRQASKEQDPDRLGELVAQINELLDIIEGRLAELQGRKPPSD
jgi:hypothetical protein